MKHSQESETIEDIKRLRQDLPQMVETLHLEDDVDISRWTSIVDKKLLPRLAGDFPLVAAICGGGSSGKSTLFNSMVQSHVSPTGGTAGINRRILAAGSAERFKKQGQFEQLLTTFGVDAQPLTGKDDLIIPGNPLFVLENNIPANLILLDTPDFDTGLNGSYTNREMAHQALELADILIYIFTNANYNNRDNTDFIARMLTDIGQRKCFLVYRVYGSYTEKEINVHAQTVARNLYGEAAAEYVLGVYRAEEDNQVAADEKFVNLTSVDKSHAVSLISEIEQLDVQALRMELNASVYEDVMISAKDMLFKANDSRNSLHLYRDALQTAQSQCVQEALQHFPIKPVLKRFSEIWFEGDPSHVKFLRKAGGVIEIPFKAAVNTAKWFAGKKEPKQDTSTHLKKFTDQFEEDLLSAVTTLWRKAVDERISVSPPPKGSGTRDSKGESQDSIIEAHPVVAEAQIKLKERDQKAALASMVDNKDAIIGISLDIERDLAQLADQFRRNTGFMFKIRQTFSALLTVLPATVAITYILSTGDPVGAAGIKVKLTGLFGLKDLYALVAIPATTGLKKADQKQLEILLAPITRTWLDDKLNTIQQLFEEEVTGGIFTIADQALESSAQLIADGEGILVRH